MPTAIYPPPWPDVLECASKDTADMDRESVVCGLVVAPRGRSHTAGGVLTRNAASSKSPLWDKANGVTWPGLWIDCLLWSLVPVGPAGRIGDSHMHCGGIRGELRSWPSYTLSSPCAAFLLYSLCTVELVASCLRGGCTDDLPIPAQRIFLDKTMLLPHTGKCVCPCYHYSAVPPSGGAAQLP